MDIDFVTQDGPSHVYTATIAKDLLLNRDSPYSEIYQLQPSLVTNWSTTVLLNATSLIFGIKHAEHALASFCILVGFFAFSYLRFALDPLQSPWTPLTNLLLCNWFLWIGFYNFYLGMALLPFVTGYYIRHTHAMNFRRTVILSLALTVLFFTHVLALLLALVTIALVALWMHKRLYTSARWTCASAFPATTLFLLFLYSSEAGNYYDPTVKWNDFPVHSFASTYGRTGEQVVVYIAMILLIGAGMLSMRRNEWLTARAPIFFAATVSFGLYLLVPNAGFGGDEIKVRFAWAVFIFGCLAASTVARMQPWRVMIAICATCFVTVTIIHSLNHNVRNVGPAVRAYSAALEKLPPGARFVRMRFEMEKTRAHFGFSNIALDPLCHVDALVAARRGLVNLSDYQAPTRTFPVTYKPVITQSAIGRLWDLEGNSETSMQSLRDLMKHSPRLFDYVVTVGDDARFSQEVGASMRLISVDTVTSFVRVYQRAD
jgi:hypothetical protein